MQHGMREITAEVYIACYLRAAGYQVGAAMYKKEMLAVYRPAVIQRERRAVAERC